MDSEQIDHGVQEAATQLNVLKKSKKRALQAEPVEEVVQEPAVVKKTKKLKLDTTLAPSHASPASPGSPEVPADPVLPAEEFCAKFNMKIAGNDIEAFLPVQSFAATKGMFPKVLRRAVCAGFVRPTPIQSQCWPVLFAGRDIVGIAETGSGKTLTFLLPLISRMMSGVDEVDVPAPKKKFNGSQPKILVVAPTRELAMQTAEVAEVAGAACGFASLCVYGGVSKGEQFKALRQNSVQLLVATPGRLLDLVQCDNASLALGSVQYLVLDEADRMLDKGFEDAIRSIIGMCRPLPQRQTALFSATWPDSIRQLAEEFLNDPVRITIGSEDLTANVRVKQIVEVLEQFQKEKRLLQLLSDYHRPAKGEINRILIFALYKKEADRIEQLLKRNGWNCESIHGDKSQDARTSALAKFKAGTSQLLIATDVAARGLDIPDVKYVLNVTFPLTIEDYIHRIGRTGRAGKQGISHTLFTSADKSHAGGLANVLREAEQVVPEDLIKFGVFTKKKEHGMYGAHFKDVDMNAKATKVTFD